MSKKKQQPDTFRQLGLLRAACLRVSRRLWEETGAGEPEGSLLFGRCADVAVVVQAVMGGVVVRGRVEGARHFWNRLPDGQEVDLTSCQFGGDGYTPFKRGRIAKRDRLTPLRFLAFANEVANELLPVVSEDGGAP